MRLGMTARPGQLRAIGSSGSPATMTTAEAEGAFLGEDTLRVLMAACPRRQGICPDLICWPRLAAAARAARKRRGPICPCKRVLVLSLAVVVWSWEEGREERMPSCQMAHGFAKLVKRRAISIQSRPRNKSAQSAVSRESGSCRRLAPPRVWNRTSHPSANLCSMRPTQDRLHTRLTYQSKGGIEDRPRGRRAGKGRLLKRAPCRRKSIG